MELRQYQQDAIDEIFQFWEITGGRNGLVVAPTGSGKSVIIGALAKEVCTRSPDTRIMVLTDSRELISQNEKTLRKIWPEASTGIYSAGLGKRQTFASVLFCGIQSVYNKAWNFGKIDLVFVDECHMISRKSQTRYGKFFADMKIANPLITYLGFSATPFRMDQGMLTDGDGALFDGIAYVCEMKRLIAEGYLVPVISKGGVAEIDLKDVHVIAGEYNSAELAHSADSPELVRLAVEEIVKYGENRKAWLVFASSVLHSQHVAEEFQKHGIKCEVVTGETPIEKRDETINKFKAGKLRCMINVAVFIKGFDAPICDLLALLTSTRSTGKYIQMVGRSMRTYPGKENALLLDYGQNVSNLGIIDEIDPIRRKNIFCVPKRAPPTKICEKCHRIVHLSTITCPECGFKFKGSDRAEARHGAEAYSGAVLASQQKTYMVDLVGDPWYSIHRKPGKIPSLRVDYGDKNDRTYSIWICADHDGYAGDKARQTIKQMGGKAKTVEEAYQEAPYWRKPVAIQVKPDGRFLKITGFKFSDKVQSTQACIEGVKDD